MQLCHYISLSLFPTIWSHHRVAPIYVNDSHKRGKSVILALNFTSFCSVGSNPVAWLFQTPRDRPRFQKNLLPVSPAKQAVGRVSLSGGSITWRWVKMLKWMWNGCERWITLACWPTQPYWVFWMWTQGRCGWVAETCETQAEACWHHRHMGVSINGGTPNGWFIMEHQWRSNYSKLQ